MQVSLYYLKKYIFKWGCPDSQESVLDGLDYSMLEYTNLP
jgi:hypothetical protein